MLFKWLFFPIYLFAVSYTPLRAPITPYLSGDTFRAFADHAYDEITHLIPQLVKEGDTIFVKGDLLETYFSQHHPHIPHKYILITHNTDHSIPGKFASYLDDDRILAWFTQNPDICDHPKLHPHPIGLENRYWKPDNVEVITHIAAKKLPKIHLLYSNFSTTSYLPERPHVYELLAHAPFTYMQFRKRYPLFIEEIALSKFVLSPRGNGLDTHRLWESLYTGSYPVVKTSTLDFLYADLPVVIVSDWTEVTEEFLNQKYDEFQNKKYNLEKLYTDYWFRRIDECRRNPKNF